MAGNSQRPNRRKAGAKKGAIVGSGAQRRKQLKGKGPTPPAEERGHHPAAKKAAAARRASSATPRPGQPRTAPGRRAAAAKDSPELLVGRNPVSEALRAEIPATALYVASGLGTDDRVTEAIAIAADRGLSILEVSRQELDRMTGGVLHQGIGLQVPPYQYHDLEDVFRVASESRTTPLLVALDGVTDPRNLGAVIRSAAAFGAQGVILPERRAAGMTATAWRTSAGAAARLPVARVTNLVRTLKACQEAGYFVVGLDADGETTVDELEAADRSAGGRGRLGGPWPLAPGRRVV